MTRNLLVAAFVAFVPMTASAAEVMTDTQMDAVTAGFDFPSFPTGNFFTVSVVQTGGGTNTYSLVITQTNP